jgi:hypothetical protein
VREWLAGSDEDLSERLERELADDGSKDPLRRASKIRERMRYDIKKNVDDACMRAGCLEVAEPLVAIVVNLLAPVTDRPATCSFPDVLQQLIAAKQTLKTAHRPPVWLCRLVDWLVIFLEGNT